MSVQRHEQPVLLTLSPWRSSPSCCSPSWSTRRWRGGSSSPPTRRCRPKPPWSATPSVPSPSSQRNWSRSSAGWRELNVTNLMQSTISGYHSSSCLQLARMRSRRQFQPRSSPQSLPTSPTILRVHKLINQSGILETLQFLPTKMPLL